MKQVMFASYFFFLEIKLFKLEELLIFKFNSLFSLLTYFIYDSLYNFKTFGVFVYLTIISIVQMFLLSWLKLVLEHLVAAYRYLTEWENVLDLTLRPSGLVATAFMDNIDSTDIFILLSTSKRYRSLLSRYSLLKNIESPKRKLLTKLESKWCFKL